MTRRTLQTVAGGIAIGCFLALVLPPFRGKVALLGLLALAVASAAAHQRGVFPRKRRASTGHDEESGPPEIGIAMESVQQSAFKRDRLRQQQQEQEYLFNQFPHVPPPLILDALRNMEGDLARTVHFIRTTFPPRRPPSPSLGSYDGLVAEIAALATYVQTLEHQMPTATTAETAAGCEYALAEADRLGKLCLTFEHASGTSCTAAFHQLDAVVAAARQIQVQTNDAALLRAASTPTGISAAPQLAPEVQQLQSMFPAASADALVALLGACGGDVALAAERLIVPSGNHQHGSRAPAHAVAVQATPQHRPLFTGNCTLYEFHKELFEWTERGAGCLAMEELSGDRHDSGLRVQMRDARGRLLTTHEINPVQTTLHTGRAADKAFVWNAVEQTNGQSQDVTFQATFDNDAVAMEFRNIVQFHARTAPRRRGSSANAPSAPASLEGAGGDTVTRSLPLKGMLAASAIVAPQISKHDKTK